MSTLTSIRKRLAPASADMYLVGIVLLLAAIGIAAVYSAVTFLAEAQTGGSSETFLVRHIVHVGVALGAMMVLSVIDYRSVARFSKFFLIGSIGLLIAVQLFGVATGGATRWLHIGPVSFQPSDVAKVALLLYVAVLLVGKQSYIKSFNRAFTPVLFWILFTVVLIGLEDLSTAFVVFMSCLIMCLVGRVSIAHLGGLSLLCFCLAGMLLLFSPSRAARVEAYVNMNIFPNTEAEAVFDAQREGYQSDQARIAFAMGGLTGRGPGKSIQRDFLPAPYNDFIFAIIAEEYGILGALSLLGLFTVFLFRGFLRVARRAVDPLGLVLATGITTMIGLYAFVHAGVSVGILPVTGLPMPFVSYGGTSLVSSGVMVGILLNISRHTSDS